MSPLRLALAACFALFVTPVVAVDLLLPGQYHGDEITAHDGETWFALVVDEHGGTHLEPRPGGLDHAFSLHGSPAGRLHPDCNDHPKLRDCTLFLDHDGRSQVLGRWQANVAARESQMMLGSDAWPHVIWAGERVGEAAVLRSVGC